MRIYEGRHQQQTVALDDLCTCRGIGSARLGYFSDSTVTDQHVAGLVESGPRVKDPSATE
jgi:hypothetical protein